MLPLDTRGINEEQQDLEQKNTKRLIKLIDTCGAETIIQQRGQLNPTKHTAVIQALG